MTTYADPTRCPDCHAVLPQDPQVCRVCSLPLTGNTVVSLFATLQEADRLLGVLRAGKQPVPTAVGAPTVTGSRLDGAERYPAADTRPAGVREEPRLRGPSVPKILLSLGALCLLVAAVIFLAVAWSWLGVGGRTDVLVGLTGTALVLAVVMHGRELRVAAEALSVVGLGLLVVDMVGARHAGWFGPVDDGRLILLTGAVVVTAALLMLAVTSARPLVAPGAIAPVAALAAGVGAVWNDESALRMLVACAVILALGRVGTIIKLRTMVVTSLVAVGLGWLYLLLTGFDQVTEGLQTVTHVWGNAAAWPLVAATVLAAVAAPLVGLGRAATSVGLGIAALLGSYVAVAAALDNGETPAAESLLVVALAWTLVLVLLRERRVAAVIPLAGTIVFPTIEAAALMLSSFQAVVTVGAPFSSPTGVHVASVYAEPSRWLLTPLLMVVVAATCALLSCLIRLRRRTWVIALSAAAVLGGICTTSLYDVPLAVVVAAVLAVAVAVLVAAESLTGSAADLARLGALVLTAGSALLALPSDRMTTAVLAVACLMAGCLLTRRDTTGALAALCFPVAFAGLVWAGGNAAGVDEQLRALPVLVVLGAIAILRPRLEFETSTVLAGTWVAAASILAAPDVDVSLAVHLTLAGALVTASSIVNPSRRALAWPGGLLLAVDTWVRLADLGVHLPEAYTLPSALALVVVGGWRLRQDARSATLTCLAPGLVLATVPSLIATLDDPSSVRALLLGVACLGLIVAGTAARWSAPVVVGAAVGTLLVLRELAPYAAATPTWLTIGLSGAVLLLVGITWESRMSDVQRASRYVAALR